MSPYTIVTGSTTYELVMSAVRRDFSCIVLLTKFAKVVMALQKIFNGTSYEPIVHSPVITLTVTMRLSFLRAVVQRISYCSLWAEGYRSRTSSGYQPALVGLMDSTRALSDFPSSANIKIYTKTKSLL